MRQILTKTKPKKPETVANPVAARKLFNELCKFTEETWCNYLFNRDLLVAKVDDKQRAELIENSIKCGQNLVRKVQKKHPGLATEDIAHELPIFIHHETSQKVEGQIFLATFTEPDEIKIYDEPLQKLQEQRLAEFTQKRVTEIILGHELFHYFESTDSELYTRSTKIELWQFLGYHHQSTVRSTSEIAAMVFSWRLNDLAFSPLVLDVLMLFCYNESAAIAIRDELRELQAV